MENSKYVEPSEMLTEVWKMKDKLYEETRNLGCEELFNYIDNKTEATVRTISKAQKTKV